LIYQQLSEKLYTISANEGLQPAPKRVTNDPTEGPPRFVGLAFDLSTIV